MEYVAARSLATEQYHYQEALDSQGGDLFSQLNNITIKRLLIAKGVISSVTESHFSYFSGLRGGGGGLRLVVHIVGRGNVTGWSTGAVVEECVQAFPWTMN